MVSGVPTEREGWMLRNSTCGANVCMHYRQGGEEVVAKERCGSGWHGRSGGIFP